jgi:hypothetical protein
MFKLFQYIVVLIMFTSCYTTNIIKSQHIVEEVIMVDTTYNVISHFNIGNTCFYHCKAMEIEVDTLEIDVFY